MHIKVGKRELKEIGQFKYLVSVLTKDAYYTREFKMKIVMTKEVFNRKISLLTSKLNNKLRNKLVRRYVCSIA